MEAEGFWHWVQPGHDQMAHCLDQSQNGKVVGSCGKSSTASFRCIPQTPEGKEVEYVRIWSQTPQTDKTTLLTPRHSQLVPEHNIHQETPETGISTNKSSDFFFDIELPRPFVCCGSP